MVLKLIPQSILYTLVLPLPPSSIVSRPTTSSSIGTVESFGRYLRALKNEMSTQSSSSTSLGVEEKKENDYETSRQRRRTKYTKKRYGNSVMDVNLQDAILAMEFPNFLVRNLSFDDDYRIVITFSPATTSHDASELKQFAPSSILSQLQCLQTSCRLDPEDVVIELDSLPWTASEKRERVINPSNTLGLHKDQETGT